MSSSIWCPQLINNFKILPPSKAGMSTEAINSAIAKAQHDTETIRERIRIKKRQLADTTRKYAMALDFSQ